jgi:hypothetical protein
MMTDPTSWASPDAPVGVSDATLSREDEEEAPAGDPEYSDLLDTDWLERMADARERDDDLVDVGLTLDVADRDDADELAQVLDLDVGVLLTSLPSPVSRNAGSAEGAEPERELGDGSLSVGALRDVLLPEERAVRERAEDDDEVGDDGRFPAFESSSEQRPRVPGNEDDSTQGEE